MFLFKKFISSFLMPLPLAIILSTTGLVLLYLKTRVKTALRLILSGMLFLCLFSYSPFGDVLISPLVNRYPAFPDSTEVSYVVVLGHGHTSSPERSAVNELSQNSLRRLSEGIRIMRLSPESRLVVSGYSGRDKVSNAHTMYEAAVSIGVDSSRIITEPRPKDTKDEAEYISRLVRGRQFALVTDATHMTRAAALFRHQGTDPVPAPVYAFRPCKTVFTMPGAGGLVKSERAFHEYLGIIWAKIRGQI